MLHVRRFNKYIEIVDEIKLFFRLNKIRGEKYKIMITIRQADMGLVIISLLFHKCGVVTICP